MEVFMDHKSIFPDMRFRRTTLLLIGLILFSFSQAWADPFSEKVDAIIGKIPQEEAWKDKVKIKVGLANLAANDTRMHSDFAKRFAQDVENAISANTRLVPLKHQDIEVALRERDMHQKTGILPKTSSEIGKRVGADVMLVATYEEQGKDAGIAIQVIDVEKGEVVDRDTISGIPRISYLGKAWQEFKKNPVHSITFLVGLATALISVLLVWLFVKLWQRFSGKFWNIVARMGTLPGLWKLAIHAYLRDMRESFGWVMNIYLDREERLDLHQVFVPLSLSTRDGEEEVDVYRRSTREVLTNPEQRRLVILGDPGSGKTTLLKALASGVSRRQWVEYQNLIPIFISLRSYSQQNDELNLHDWLTESILLRHGMRNAKALLESLMHEGRILLLLDGLDEVNEEDQPAVIQRIMDCLERWDEHKECRVFITCREQNFNLLSDTRLFRRHGFHEYRLTKMRDSELEAMVHNRREDFAKREKSPEGFLRAVYTTPSITELHRNPLLLTISIGLYIDRVDDTVPHNLATFYEESIDNLLKRRGANSRFDPRDKYLLLQKFALHSMEEATQQKRDFEEFPIRALIGEAEGMARDSVHVSEEQAGFLVREIHTNAGLINDLGDRQNYTFAHRSLHEFCAASQLAKLGTEGFQQLSEMLDQPAWYQTIIFYCSIDHQLAGELIETLLEQAREQMVLKHAAIHPLSLAGECAAVLASPKVLLRLRVVETLVDVLSMTPGDARRFLLIALLKLGRDAPEEVREAVDKALRRIIHLEQPEQLARELNRLEKSAALSLLDFMIDTDDAKRQQAALLGLTELDESIEKIDPLWQLLEIFYNRGDSERTDHARRQLLKLMTLEEAVARLDSLPTRLTQAADEEAVRNIYPFTPEIEPPSNFARLLALEAQSKDNNATIDNWQIQGQTWQSFLNAVASSTKSDKAKNFWRNLPHDSKRRVWRIHWQTLGRVLVGLGLLAGGLASTLFLLNFNPDERAIVALLFVVFAAVFVAFSTSALWPLWRGLARRFGWLSGYGSAPRWLTPWLEGIPQFRSLVQGVVRAGYLSIAVVLVFLALFTTHPYWKGHTSWVLRVAFSPDGRRILTVSSDGTARIWNVATGKEIQRFEVPKGSVSSLALSPDGRQILIASSDNTARIWEIATGKEIYRFEVPKGSVSSLAFSPDGRQILTASSDGTARIWEIATGKEIQRFEGHTGWVSSVDFSPDGSQILTGSDDDTACLWETTTGKFLWRTPIPFWNVKTWGWDDVILSFVFVCLFIFLPTTRLFDPGRILYLRTPNPYLPLFDMPGIERWLPVEYLADAGG